MSDDGRSSGSHQLAVITPSHAPDLDLFEDLHRSVLEFTGPEVVHHVVVPDRQVAAFAPLAGPRCAIWPESTLLPRSMRATPWAGALSNMVRPLIRLPSVAAVNVRRPWPPVRGWILQQVLKLELATRVGADVLLLVDSDVVLIRPVSGRTFLRQGVVQLYRRDGAVDSSLPRHLQWHGTARRLLGLAPAQPPFPDYVSSFLAWDRDVVVQLRGHLERENRRPWLDLVAGQLQISEWTLYGVFLADVLGLPAAAMTDDSLCHSYWDPMPLSDAAAGEFVSRVRPQDVALHIQSKSRTSLEVRRRALEAVRDRGGR